VIRGLVALAGVLVALGDIDREPPSGPAPGPQASTRPVGATPMPDAEAAKHVRPAREARVRNRVPNAWRLGAPDLAEYGRHAWTGVRPEAQALRRAVTGQFTGTTDEIIQWAAWKWGVDEDLFRAVCVQESWWRQETIGDGGLSFGITQVNRDAHPGTYPYSRFSTAFAADYYGAIFRHYYDGHATWLMDVEHGQPYRPGDAWGAVGTWFAGRWHTPPADDYVRQVQGHLKGRTWAWADFR
jgi:autotransporter family porin